MCELHFVNVSRLCASYAFIWTNSTRYVFLMIFFFSCVTQLESKCTQIKHTVCEICFAKRAKAKSTQKNAKTERKTPRTFIYLKFHFSPFFDYIVLIANILCWYAFLRVSENIRCIFNVRALSFILSVVCGLRDKAKVYISICLLVSWKNSSKNLWCKCQLQKQHYLSYIVVKWLRRGIPVISISYNRSVVNG